MSSLAQLLPRTPLKIDPVDLSVGTQVCAWGHPAPYDGPAPLMIVGHVAGFSQHDTVTLPGPQRRLVVNAAFNPGNSGGPVTRKGSSAVSGVVVSKATHVPPHLSAAINAMANQKGITISYPVTLPDGTERRMVEAEIVADTLRHFFRMTQLVLGEAILSRDLVPFLNRYRIPWTEA